MSGIVPGYNYDIFISYRQKDNKGDGWVSEFVEALKTELESTFKEEISVYFDINPHDGLLETHDVDESLKDKLKCLVFIPIISRTYCDPKAFAWEHEFKAFVEQASNDQFGLKVKLPNGNVASRVLPIIIYDLDKQDIKLFESVLGSVLRGVEFIYKSAGVNRPLRLKDDLIIEPRKIFYRDQVNKVANTIKDVLNSLTVEEPSVEEATEERSVADEKTGTRKPAKKKPGKIPTVSLLYRLKNLARLNLTTWRVIALVFIIVSIGFIWLYLNKPSPPDRAELKSDIPLAKAPGKTNRKALDLSPDGKYLVYCMNDELNLIQLNSDSPSEPISGTKYSSTPFFSPDGKWIGFINYEEMRLMKIPPTGGNPVPICYLEGAILQANWYENEIIYASEGAIYRVPDTGGTPEKLYPLNDSDNDAILWDPQLLPDKKTLLFSQVSMATGTIDWYKSIVTWRLGSKEDPVVLVEGGRDGRYLKSGHIAYTMNARLYIRKFNTRTNRVTSEPQIIETNPIFEYDIDVINSSSQYDFSENGILVYYEVPIRGKFNIVWVDEYGSVSPPITNEAKAYRNTVISSNAQYIAVDIQNERKYRRIEIINVKTGNSQLLADTAVFPVWSPDNSSVYYVSNITGDQVFQKPLDLSTPPVMLFEIDEWTTLSGISDGKYLSFTEGYTIGYYDLINNKVEMLNHYKSTGHLGGCAISPDGKWIAYLSNDGGQAAIYVAPFPGPGQPKRVTSPRVKSDIYGRPVWAPDMTALYYWTLKPDFEMWRIDMHFTENDFSFEQAHSFFNGSNDYIAGDVSFAIHPDGGRFLVLDKAWDTNDTTECFKVIVNWEQELYSK